MNIKSFPLHEQPVFFSASVVSILKQSRTISWWYSEWKANECPLREIKLDGRSRRRRRHRRKYIWGTGAKVFVCYGADKPTEKKNWDEVFQLSGRWIGLKLYLRGVFLGVQSNLMLRDEKRATCVKTEGILNCLRKREKSFYCKKWKKPHTTLQQHRKLFICTGLL